MAKARRADPAATAYRRAAARVTSAQVLHETDKARLVAASPPLRRKSARVRLTEEWAAAERVAAAEAARTLTVLRQSAEQLGEALGVLAAAGARELVGAAETEREQVRTALERYADAAAAVERRDFGAAGAAAEEADGALGATQHGFVVALNRALSTCAVGRDVRARLETNVAGRRAAKQVYDRAVVGGEPPETVAAAAAVLRAGQAEGYRLAADVLASQVLDRTAGEVAGVGRENTVRVLAPHECETFADVGGLLEVKRRIAETLGTVLERPDEAARYGVTHNGILFHGPPGTGKNLLSRAIAGEYGLRYIRFSPAAIASAYIHQAATNLKNVFELGRSSAPCVLFLDEIDTIASDRGAQPSADHREVVTQLMICLEEYRSVPGLVIAAATNDLDRLDPALREGRFDTKVLVPLPDATERADVIDVHLRRRDDAVDWPSVDLVELARVTAGYSSAALETVVSLAAQAALRERTPITGPVVRQAIADRGGRSRLALDQVVTWDDVVLTDHTRDRVHEVLTVFAEPDLARRLGVTAPAGLLLYGPPGTGKTTIAKAMASQVAASFYELSAAELMSKWAGESEQRVSKLFTKARADRPAIVFIDEVDALLRRRAGTSGAKWEERVLSQFLRELDGLRGGDGVLFVGATNRVDTIDEAIVGRRLEPIEVGLPDSAMRLRLLQLLCRDVALAKNVNLRTLVTATKGMSGADLKRLRDTAGRKALSRAARGGKGATVTMADFLGALDTQRSQKSLAAV
jgi:transitional endoplasmic reticulum ATPase